MKHNYKQDIQKTIDMKNEMKEKIFAISNNFVTNPAHIAEYMAFSAKFCRYSARNTMLIYAQNRGASFVQSFAAWKSMGANILRGSKGMKILVPVQKTFLGTPEENIPLSAASAEQKLAYRAGSIPSFKRTFFSIGNVFDIAQTDFPKERYPELLNMGVPSKFHNRAFEALSDFSKYVLDCPVLVQDIQSASLRGFYEPGKNKITINHLLDDTQRISTLAHECGHALAHNIPSDKSLHQKEFEGDCLGIMLESRFNIAPTDTRKRHLSEHFHALKDELLAGITPGMDFSIEEKLESIFSDVYSIYNEYTPALDHYIDSYFSREELALGASMPEAASLRTSKQQDFDMEL